jgi:hypothetical protein
LHTVPQLLVNDEDAKNYSVKSERDPIDGSDAAHAVVNQRCKVKRVIMGYPSHPTYKSSSYTDVTER